MQGGIYSRCKFRSVISPIQKAVYITAFVASRQQIIEFPHGEFTAKTAKIIIADICLSHCINLRIRK